MNGFILCVFAILMVTPTKGEEEEQLEQLDQLENEEVATLLECFRCDLGFWDACYTTTTNCSTGEKCYTGRGKADGLEVKTLGCVKEEECGTETTVELFSKTIVYMTKHCCHTPFCNAAHNINIKTPLYLTVTILTIWHLTGDLMGSR